MVDKTSRTGTMERELNEVPPEFDFVGMTGFFGEGWSFSKPRTLTPGTLCRRPRCLRGRPRNSSSISSSGFCASQSWVSLTSS